MDILLVLEIAIVVLLDSQYGWKFLDRFRPIRIVRFGTRVHGFADCKSIQESSSEMASRQKS